MKAILHPIIGLRPGTPLGTQNHLAATQNIRLPAIFAQPLFVKRPAIAFGELVTLAYELAGA